MAYKTIYIGGINRSGGSLLARLFDGHPNVLSYPIEVGFPANNDFYQMFESYTGIPETVPTFDKSKSQDIDTILNLPKQKGRVVLRWGKEQSDPVGVRKNYLEKVFYGTVKTDFDYVGFRENLERRAKAAKSIREIWDIRHDTYFNAWDRGEHKGSAQFVAMHTSSGFYLTNVETFFNEFNDATFIHPIRDIMGYIASEKTRLAKRFYGSRRFSYPRFPNILVKTFKGYDLNAQIRAWMVAVTRAVLLQEKWGVNGRFLVYRHENLVNNTGGTMKSLCDGMNLEYNSILQTPTIAGQPWQGNSHQGPRKGVSKDLTTYYTKVLRKDEIQTIQKVAGKVRNYLMSCVGTPIDLTKIDKSFLYDYDYQKKYFEDTEKITLYYALVNSGRRSKMVKKQDITSIIAFLYAKMVRIIHTPRMLKLRFFPGVGKQNYT